MQKFFPFALYLAQGDHEWRAGKEKPYEFCILRADCLFAPVGP